MRTATRATKTFSLDRDILETVKKTKGRGSESERVNALLRRALEAERRAALSDEAESFFASVPTDRKERSAFQSAGIAAWKRK
jgi:hypothetical protein